MASVAAHWERHDGSEGYREWMSTATADLGVPIVRAPEGLAVDSDFFDPVHLNADGALKFSRWLAQDVATALEELEADPSPVQLAQTNPSK